MDNMEIQKRTVFSPDASISLINVCVDYPEHPGALKGINLEIYSGERITILGASGSGKSTLLRAMNGLAPVSSGQIRIAGYSIFPLNNGVIRHARRKIGTIFQDYNLVDRLPVLTNVLTGCLGRINPYRSVMGYFTKSEKELAMDCLKKVGLENYADRRADKLSGGQKQRVAIARALMQQSTILLADEPVASLDMENAESIMILLSELQRDLGITLIMSVHDIEHALNYSDRVIGLKEGMIVHDAPSQTLKYSGINKIFQLRKDPQYAILS